MNWKEFFKPIKEQKSPFVGLLIFFFVVFFRDIGVRNCFLIGPCNGFDCLEKSCAAIYSILSIFLSFIVTYIIILIINKIKKKK